MRVLLLVTTHLSLEHITFLRKCWPPATHTGPTETVRRGWNRTAGSRYAFAADGVTFESSGGI